VDPGDKLHSFYQYQAPFPAPRRLAEEFKGTSPVIIKMKTRLPFILIALVLTTVAFLFGAVQPWVWSFYVMTIFLAYSFHVSSSSYNIPNPLRRIPSIAVGIFLLLALLQIIPLPNVFWEFLGSQRNIISISSNSLLDLPVKNVALSYNPSYSLGWWLFLISLVLLFSVLRTTVSRPRIQILIWLLFVVSSLQALYGIIQALIPNLGVLSVDYIQAYLGDARGTYINRNHFAGYMEMMIPLMLGFALSREDWNGEIDWKTLFASDRPHLQFLLSLGLVIMVLALLFSRSRAGITGFVIGLGVFLYLIRSGRKAVPLSVKATFLVIGGLVLFYGLRIGFNPIFERFLQISTDASRTDFWRDSLPIIAAHPFGTGLGTFEQVFAVHNTSTLVDIRVTHLHNDYLQLLMEAGWIGFGAVVGLFYWFLATSMRKVSRMRIDDDPLKFFVAAGSLSGLISMAFHSFFDFNLQIPANCVYFVTLIAFVQICTGKATQKATIDQDRPIAGTIYVR
jgi:O-antigen ligase